MAKPIAPETKTPISWEFERNHRYLVCEVRQQSASSSFEVTMVPLWAGGRSEVELFDSPRAAFQRHATIAADLRSDGWTVASYTT